MPHAKIVLPDFYFFVKACGFGLVEGPSLMRNAEVASWPFAPVAFDCCPVGIFDFFDLSWRSGARWCFAFF